jgi:hypothetical protein
MMRRIRRANRSYDSATVNPVERGAHAMLTKPKKDMTAEDLRKNMLSTYFTLRTGIVVLAAALPVGLLVYSLWYHHGLDEDSMSAFYGAYDGAMRNWFVGILWAVGAFLILYKGFSSAENWLLNLAGGFAILTAITPCYCWGDAVGKSKLHTIFAVLFFLCMACVCWFCAEDTITLLPKESQQDRFRRTYRTIALFLLLSPLGAAAAAYLARVPDGRIFFIEWFGVWVFAAYWLAKSAEFHITSAEKLALQGHVKNVRGIGLVPAAAADQQTPLIPPG